MWFNPLSGNKDIHHTSITHRSFPHLSKPFNYGRLVCSAASYSGSSSNMHAYRFNRPKPFGGKSGSISFYGVTHQVVGEGKLVSSPEKKWSFLWVLARVVLISLLVLLQFFFSNSIDSLLKDEILAEIVFFVSEAMFYLGLAAFLLITDRVQKPYLQFSPKRWGLITGLNGYLISAFFTMGFKVFVPFMIMYVTWPPLGLAAPVAVAPFLVGCAAQFASEGQLDKRGSSYWPFSPYHI